MKALPFAADYQKERLLVSALLDDACAERILLVMGESGMGKSTLLRACRAEAEERDVLFCPIDLRGNSMSISEIFSSVVRRVGWDEFPTFQEHVGREGIQVPQVQVEGNRLLGTNQQIQVALQVNDPAERVQRLAAMTDAFFSDLASLSRPLVLAMDTYEKASPEVAEWVAGPFLRRVADTGTVRVVVAGRRVPETTLDWDDCCLRCELYGVREPREWLPIVKAMGCQVPEEPALTFLAGLCHAFEGRPSDIAKTIEGLPRKEAS